MPNYPAVYSLAAGLEYLHTTGVTAIEEHADPLIRTCVNELKKLPVELLNPDELGSLAGIIALRHPRAAQIHRRLQTRNIHVMHHAGRLRIALHGYNTTADVDRFLSEFREAINDA
jgi:selenocysteine lyase/cysteine desulfurase